MVSLMEKKLCLHKFYNKRAFDLLKGLIGRMKARETVSQPSVKMFCELKGGESFADVAT